MRAARAHLVRRRFTEHGRESLERHERLIALLAAGDTAGASDLTFETWHTLVVDEAS